MWSKVWSGKLKEFLTEVTLLKNDEKRELSEWKLINMFFLSSLVNIEHVILIKTKKRFENLTQAAVIGRITNLLA